MSREDHLGHPADFRVRYRFRAADEGGRQTLPVQGYRSDFLYEEDDAPGAGIYMIHPEFEDSMGLPIAEEERAAAEGTARMWIISDEMREVHRGRIKPGVRGYMVEGARKVAEIEVIEVLGLHTNPMSPDVPSGNDTCQKCGGTWPAPAPIASGLFRLARDLVDQHSSLHAIAELRKRTGCSLTTAKAVQQHLGSADDRCHECSAALTGPRVTNCSSCGALNYWVGDSA